MDLTYSTAHEAFRARVKTFLEGWPLKGAEAERPLAEQEAIFRNRGIEAGFVYRHVPKRYGGSEQPRDAIEDQIIQEEFYRAGAPRDLTSQGAGMLVPTLLEFGTEAQKARYIPPALRGEESWCQGYSEPGSGSDLASLQCQARLEGDEWVLKGQKIWTSGAQRAHMMFGLFRTEPNAKKHEGISYLLVPMNTKGIEVRPLREMTGGYEFNEVFFDDARIPADHIVAARGQGWQVSRATLVHERNLIGNPFMMREAFQDLVELARSRRRNGRPAIEDPSVRQRLAEIEGYVRASETSNLRQFSAAQRGEMAKVMRPVLMNKVFSTDTMQRIARCAYDLIGGDGVLAPQEEELHGWGRRSTPSGWVLQYIFSMGPAIAGGATNIQLNIIGERGYGLPRDLHRGK
ncbi:MAG: acyl-CoA dehydrogenase family protein [Deltaproteobacteria bacterium]|nr:acyl-CoA dehydrogenase family protein [Deltaproteobacteria bacterium]